jgi:hypothetical protein
MNRAALLQAIEPMIEPGPTQREAIRKSLDKALVDLTLALPIHSAQSLPPESRDELEIVIRDLMGAKEVGSLAASWEPQRKLDSDLKLNLKIDLIDLLQRRRKPYAGLRLIPLNEARQAGDEYRKHIQRDVPTAELKKMLKAWDKNFKPISSTRAAVIQRLMALLAGAAPEVKASAVKSKRAA